MSLSLSLSVYIEYYLDCTYLEFPKRSWDLGSLIIPGTWYLLPGARYLVPGTRCLVPGTWYQVPRYLAPGTWSSQGPWIPRPLGNSRTQGNQSPATGNNMPVKDRQGETRRLQSSPREIGEIYYLLPASGQIVPGKSCKKYPWGRIWEGVPKSAEVKLKSLLQIRKVLIYGVILGENGKECPHTDPARDPMRDPARIPHGRRILGTSWLKFIWFLAKLMWHLPEACFVLWGLLSS
jgi:hypothetical protein